MRIGNAFRAKRPGPAKERMGYGAMNEPPRAVDSRIDFLKDSHLERPADPGRPTAAKPAGPVAPEKSDGEYIEIGHRGPIGLDIGTANVVVAQNKDKDISTHIQLNAFFPIPYTSITRQTLQRDNIPFLQKGRSLYVLGYSAQNFANMLGADTRKPVESGIVNPKEHEGVSVIKVIINKLVKRAKRTGERVCFNVPGRPIDSQASVVYHESIIEMHLKSLGYSPVPINEGLAVVLSELSGNNFTGIGISMGGGMCNVCFSYLSVPIIAFSMQKGGDYIDSMVGLSVGEPPTKIKVIKEKELDLSKEPKSRVETGLHIYYNELFSILCKNLEQVMGSSDAMPKLSKAIPVVLSGGTVIPKGSRGKFIQALRDIRVPFKISDIIMVKQPLYATAKGALMMAMSEEIEL